MITLPEAASPLHEKFKDYVLENISNGTWARNAKVPSEHELVATIGVSRMTVHRAPRELTAAGFLKRIQGVGAFVKVPGPRAGLLEINTIAAEIETRENRHASNVIVMEKISTSHDLTRRFESTAVEKSSIPSSFISRTTLRCSSNRASSIRNWCPPTGSRTSPARRRSTT